MNRRELLMATAATGALLTTGVATAAPAKLPKLVFRRSKDRGHADHGWLNARHTFSFARYNDPNNMSFRALRVMNEDYIAAGRGFPMHPHDNMEIVTYVLDGALQHRDTLGNGSVIRPGEVQQMSAGTGIRHSEFNPMKNKKTHLMQIWMVPDRKGHKPNWGQKTFAFGDGKGLKLVASRGGHGGSLHINSDQNMYAGKLNAGMTITHRVPKGRHAWVQLARGEVKVNGQTAFAGDGVRTSDAGDLTIVATKPSEMLIFDLA